MLPYLLECHLQALCRLRYFLRAVSVRRKVVLGNAYTYIKIVCIRRKSGLVMVLRKGPHQIYILSTKSGTKAGHRVFTNIPCRYFLPNSTHQQDPSCFPRSSGRREREGSNCYFISMHISSSQLLQLHIHRIVENTIKGFLVWTSIGWNSTIYFTSGKDCCSFGKVDEEFFINISSGVEAQTVDYC